MLVHFTSKSMRIRRARSTRTSWRITVLLALAASGCGKDAVAPTPAVNDPGMYWSLTLDHRAVTLSTVAPYDTIRLTATPRTLDGEPMTGLSQPIFTSLDLDRAQVSADGLVRVIKTGSRIPVVATLSSGNLMHADTVLITATLDDPPPVLAELSIQPLPGDSAKTAIGSPATVSARATTADGTPIDASVYFTSLDPTTATIDRATGFLSPLHPGRVTIVASATVYGVTRSDTLSYRIGYPVGAVLTILPQKDASGRTVGVFTPNRLTLGPGAIVLFSNQTATATDVTFDDPTNVAQDDRDCMFIPSFCGSGNIAPFVRDPADATGLTGARVRRFPVPGTYSYHSTIYGTSGTIVIADESATP